MGIVDEDIARVRAATDFVAVAGEHVGLRRVGRRWVGLCPFHTEKSPSFGISAELGFYYCFGCQAKGDVITFVRELDHLDFVGAVEKLASRAGITLRYDDASGGRDHQRRNQVYETLAAAVGWYHHRLLSSPDARAARAYLRGQRGYDGDVVRRYQLGWAPEGWDQLLRSLRLPPVSLVEAGLAYVNDAGRHNDFFRGRLLFPIFDAAGRPVGAGGRILPGGRGPKYKNTPATSVYDKSRLLYGLNWAKTSVVDAGHVVVCEGYTDVIGLHHAGVTQAVATCGTALADGHVRLLTNFARRIVLAYDADAAGQHAAEQYYDWEKRFEVDIRVAALPPGADPGDLARRDPEALRRAIADARPYLAFRLERLFDSAELTTAEGRARAAGEAMGLIGAHPNVLVRDQYLMLVADRCRVSPDRLRSMPATPPGAAPSTSRRPPDRAHDNDTDRAAAVPVVPGSELEALRLAVHQPETVANRLEAVLFDHALARSAFLALVDAATLHDAVEAADPQTAHLLTRLAVEESEEEPDDVMIRLVERAGSRTLTELQAEARQAEDPAAYVPTIGWLKLTLETLRAAEQDNASLAREAERGLVAWLVARSQVPIPSQQPSVSAVLPTEATVAQVAWADGPPVEMAP
ncbi:MAG: DNA primase [Actinomycetota bacterium]|nr:DNA primase [Actinomycetota bacterium]